MQKTVDYWFTIEPYVFIGMTDKQALLYNTLDGTTIETDKDEVIKLLQEMLQNENCGVVLLTNERYIQKDVNNFIQSIREKYVGDIIDVTLSKAKPVQLFPYFNFPNKLYLYRKNNISPVKNVTVNLSEISIHVNPLTNITKLISFLQTIPGTPSFNIIGNIEEISNYVEFLSFFNQHMSPKNIMCSYKSVIALQPDCNNNFSYSISVDFPVDMQLWNYSQQLLQNQNLPVEYVFDISSENDSHQVDQFVELFQIKEYSLNPLYTGDNLCFFEKNVFLTREDILSTRMTIKDFFSRQAINIYDFGKINIMPNGDVYANLNYPLLGNIYTQNIYEIVTKELKEGNSWFRIRNQAPCNSCVFQWLCPSPSNYEIVIGRPNLCHVKNKPMK